jgi:hypothetical protein
MTSTEEAADANSARATAFRRIGRNLVNVQRIELMMKFLLSVNFSAPTEEVESYLRRHVERVSGKTLGILIKELAETVLLPVDAISTQSAKEVWLSHSINVPLGAEARNAWNKEWEKLRIERNKLVHLMLGHVDFSSPEQCRKLGIELDAQNSLFLNGIAFLRPLVTGVQATIAAMASGELVFDPPLPEVPRN